MNRNTLLDYCDPMEEVVLLEDDLKKVVKLVITEGKKKIKKIESIKELDSIIKTGFDIAKKYQTICFGVNMSVNPLNLENKVSLTRLVHTGFMGLVNTGIRFDEELKIWDDPDMNCQVIRNYGCCVSLVKYGADIDRGIYGGCYDVWNDEEDVKEAKIRFFQKNGDICTVSHTGHLILRKEITNGLRKAK